MAGASPAGRKPGRELTASGSRFSIDAASYPGVRRVLCDLSSARLIQRFLQRQDDGRARLSRISAFVPRPRSVHVRLTEKGRKLRDGLMAVHGRHINQLADAAINADDHETAEITLRRLERVPEPYRRFAGTVASRGVAHYSVSPGGEVPNQLKASLPDSREDTLRCAFRAEAGGNEDICVEPTRPRQCLRRIPLLC
jgi:hypothetical protein